MGYNDFCDTEHDPGYSDEGSANPSYVDNCYEYEGSSPCGSYYVDNSGCHNNTVFSNHQDDTYTDYFDSYTNWSDTYQQWSDSYHQHYDVYTNWNNGYLDGYQYVNWNNNVWGDHCQGYSNWSDAYVNIPAGCSCRWIDWFNDTVYPPYHDKDSWQNGCCAWTDWINYATHAVHGNGMQDPFITPAVDQNPQPHQDECGSHQNGFTGYHQNEYLTATHSDSYNHTDQAATHTDQNASTHQDSYGIHNDDSWPDHNHSPHINFCDHSDQYTGC